MSMFEELTAGIIYLRGPELEVRTQIRTGNATTPTLVLAETEDGYNNPPIGSLYLGSTGLLFRRIAAAGAAADWVEVDADAVADTSVIYVATTGDDTNGNGSASNPYATITAAMAAVTTARKTVIVAPGSYAEAAAVVWPTVSGVSLIGAGNNGEVVISASAGDQVIDIVPGVQAAAFVANIQGVRIDHSTTGQDGIDIDNTDITKDLTLNLGNVGMLADSGSDKSIITAHADTTAAIIINWDGQNGEVQGDVYLDAGNAGDIFTAQNVLLAAGMETAADATAFVITLKYCGVLHEGVTGGNAAQTITTIHSYSLTGSTYAAVDTNDLAGSHTENII